MFVRGSIAHRKTVQSAKLGPRSVQQVGKVHSASL